MHNFKRVIILIAATGCAGEYSSDHHEPLPDLIPIPTSGPIDVSARTWAWVNFSESRCMNATPTGIAVNIEPDAKEVVIYLEGGNACFNKPSCSVTFNRDGFGENVERVILSGSSAGGFGAMLNFERVQETFTSAVDVVLVNDSAPPFGDNFIPACLQQHWRELRRDALVDLRERILVDHPISDWLQAGVNNDPSWSHVETP